jgi:competence protein ComEA
MLERLKTVHMEEIISKLRFLIDKIKYKKGRHIYISIIILLIIIVISFTVIYINMKIEIKRKENILKSYYSEISIADNSPDGSGAERTGNEINGEKTLHDNEKQHFTAGSNGDSRYGGSNSDTAGKTAAIKVYICGAVKNPGVYEVYEGARVIDLLEAAGGQNEDACIEIINLAGPLADGQRIYVPFEEEITGGSSLFFSGDLQDDYSSSGSRVVNINSASAKELETLPGVGPVIAQNIVEYRNRNGFFKKKEELKNVTGIGEKKYDKISKFISI